MNCEKCAHRVKTEGDGVCDHPIGFGADGECPLEMDEEVKKAINYIIDYCRALNKGCVHCAIRDFCDDNFDGFIPGRRWDKFEVKELAELTCGPEPEEVKCLKCGKKVYEVHKSNGFCSDCYRTKELEDNIREAVERLSMPIKQIRRDGFNELMDKLRQV